MLADLHRRAAEMESAYAKLNRTLDQAVSRATRAEACLQPFLRSRVYRAAWAAGLVARPDWVDRFDTPRRALAPPPPPPASLADDIARAAAEVDRLVRPADAQTGTLPLESEMDVALKHLVDKGFRPRVILDIGSAKGYWSERAQWLYFPDADYYMIDPLDESQDHLQELARRSPQFHPLQMAIGSQPGELVINVTPDGDGSSLLGFPSADPIARRSVPIDTIDNLLAAGRIASPDLVKVDVQGFEIEVLRGASRLFGAADAFVLEVNLFRFMPGCPLAHEVVAYMADRGYRLYDLAGTLRRPYQGDMGQMDLVFVRNDSSLVASDRWK
jgi:FkbM family methyltransferase